MPFASTLCGSCTNVCPVKIDIHDQIWKWRQIVTEAGYVDTSKKIGIHALNFVLSNPKVYRVAGNIGRKTMRIAPFLVKNNFNAWYKQHEMPEAPEESFREWFVRNKLSKKN